MPLTILTSMGAWATAARGRALGGAMEEGGRAATGRLGGGMRLLLVAVARGFKKMAAFLLASVAVSSPAAAGRSPKRSFMAWRLGAGGVVVPERCCVCCAREEVD